MMLNWRSGLLLVFLCLSLTPLNGCARSVAKPIMVESKPPQVLLVETPMPNEPDFSGATNIDLWNYALDLRSRLLECNRGKTQARAE